MASARTPSRRSSPVWGDHGFHRPAAAESGATCRVCGKTMAYKSSKNGTSHLLRHMHRHSRLKRAAAQQQQQQEVAPPVVVGEPFQPSGQQVHYLDSTTTTVTDAVDAAELHPHLLLLPQAAPTSPPGSFQPGGQQVRDATTAFADLQLHGGVEEDVHQAAAPDDFFEDQEDTMIHPHLWGFY